MVLYVCDGPEKTLYQVGLDGSDPTALFTISVRPYFPFYEPTVNKFFFTYSDLYAIDYDGSNKTIIVNDVSSIGVADVDTVNQRVYYSAHNGNKISSCDYDGGNIVQELTPTGPDRIQVDVSGGKCYWTADVALYRDTIPGGGASELVYADSGLLIEQFDLDLVNGKIYWANATDDVIRRCNLDGSNPETIVTSAAEVWGCAVDGAGGKVYYTEGTPTNVKKCNLDGSGQEVIWAGSTFPSHLYVGASPSSGGQKTRWGPWVYPSGPGRSFGQGHHTHP